MNYRGAMITLFVLCLPLGAQWLDYPTPGVPRLPNGKPNLSAPTPRTPDGKPDFSGLWDAGTDASSAPVLGGTPRAAEFLDIAAHLKGPLPYQPWARELVMARKAENGKDDPDGRCLPLGMIRMHSHLFPRKMLQLPGLLVILYEKGVDYRQIFTDGRPLPADPQPSFNGYSTGKWDGDTLVVQTVGFRDGIWLDGTGNPLTEEAKVTERFRRPDYGHLDIEVTVDDPKAYTAPWTVVLKQSIKLDTDLLEEYCENERDVRHLVGK